MKQFLCVFISVFLLVYPFSHSYGQSLILDSLNKEIQKKSIHDTTRLQLLQEIGAHKKIMRVEYWDSLANQVDHLLNQYQSNRVEKALKRSKANAFNSIGVIEGETDNPHSALKYLHKSLEMKEELGDKKGVANTYNNIGVRHYHLGKVNKALNFYKKGARIQKEINDKAGLAESYNDIGKTYADQGKIDEAIHYLKKGLKINESLGNTKNLATSYLNIAQIHFFQKDLKLAVEYLKKSLEQYKSTGNKGGMASCYNNIGYVFQEKKNYQAALKNYRKSLDIKKEINDQKGIANSYINIGVIYYKQGKKEMAMNHMQKSLQIKREMGDKKGLAVTHRNIGSLLYEDSEYNRALNYANEALKYANEVGYPKQIQSSAKLLLEIHKKQSNWNAALKNYELYIQMRDSIKNEKNQRAAIRQEYQYEYEKKAYADSIKQAEEEKVAKAKIQAQEAQLKQEQTFRYALYAGVGLLLLFGGFMVNRFRVTRRQKEIIEKQKSEVELQKNEAEHQKQLVEEKNTEILDSINYARRLQEAILPPRKLVKQWLRQSFILYKPKDIVAGDFYWMETVGDTVYFAAADCTGHGVPGAMVSVVCSNALSKAVIEEGITDPGKILDRTKALVIERFERSEESIQDGMDIALCSLNTHTHTLNYSGAHNPLWIIREGKPEVEEIKGNKQPIGRYATENPFTTHKVKLGDGDSIYIFSDGFPDQFGGPKGKKYKSGRFKKFLLSIQDKGMAKQRELIDKEFENWKGKLEQLDDVCVIGVKT